MIHKNIKALGWVSFFTDMASAMITPLLPIFLVFVLHENVQTLGYTIAIATFISYFFRILFGYLSDKFKITKPFIVIGYTISALTKPLFYYAQSWQNIASLRGVERMGKAIRSASKDRLISEYVQKNQHGKTFGFHKTMDIAGELFGALLVFCILYFWGSSEGIIRNVFALTLLPGVMGVIIMIFFVKDSPAPVKTSEYKWEKSDYRLFPILISYFLFLIFLFGDAFFLLQAKESGYTTTVLPLFVIVLTLTQTLLSYGVGEKIDQIGSEKMLLGSFFFGLFATISLYFHSLWIAFIFLGIFTVSSLNAIRSIISQKAKNKSTVYGLFYGGTAITTAFGALVVGHIWNAYGSNMAMCFSIFGSAMIIFVSFFLLKLYK